MKRFNGTLLPFKNWSYDILLCEWDLYISVRRFPVNLLEPWDTEDDLEKIKERVQAERDAWLLEWETRLNKED